jgi:N-methylhydantoinase B
VRNNVRESDKVVGDFHALAACNETGHRRLIDMLCEFNLDDLSMIGGFILKNSGEATLERLQSLPHGTWSYAIDLDGYDEPVHLAAKLTIGPEGVLVDFDGTSPMSKFGINVPLVYAKAYACYGIKCVVAPDIPNNSASLAPFSVNAPEGCILNAKRPAPVAVRHVLGHFVPDLVLGALHQALPGKVPAEGAAALWNLHMSVRPVSDQIGGKGAEILMFNSGGTGARPALDGLNATAFPSGVHTMPIEATENVGPVIIWRKELREGSGGAGAFRGGLGQNIEIEAAEGYTFRFSAMFDRLGHPAKGRDGGKPGAPGRVSLNDGTVLKGKGLQFVPAGKRLVLELPGGGGFGKPDDRPADAVEHDLKHGYITAEQANAYAKRDTK